jgi:hypothetical protein
MTTAPKALIAALLLATPLSTPRLGADDRTPRAVVVGEDGDTVEVQALPRARVHRMGGGSRLGISLVEITPELRTHFGAPKDAGVLVGSVEKDSPASRAGIEVGDVLTAVDGEKFDSSWELARAIRGKSAGDSVAIDVIRKGASRKLTAKVEKRPDSDADVELHGYLGRDFGRDLSREIRRGLRDVHPRVDMDVRPFVREWDFDRDGDRIRIGPRTRDLKALEEKVQSLERRLKELEGKKAR